MLNEKQLVVESGIRLRTRVYRGTQCETRRLYLMKTSAGHGHLTTQLRQKMPMGAIEGKTESAEY